MKKLIVVLTAAMTALALSCGDGGGPTDVVQDLAGDTGVDVVVGDLPIDTIDIREDVPPEDVKPDLPPEIIDDIPVEVDADAREDVKPGDLPVEVPDGCACIEDEDCVDAFETLGACEKAICEDCGCIKGFAAEDDPCDDGNECTEGEKCNAEHVCQGGSNVCTCTSDLDCERYDDDNLCNGSYKCNMALATPVCEIPENTIVVCEDTLGLPCRTVGCDALTGECVNINTHEGEGCDDGVGCTVTDTCTSGECVGQVDHAVCDDNNVCTDESCDPLVGCTSQFNNDPCEDGSLCTENDICSGGLCTAGPAAECTDGLECTDDSCDPATGCVFTDQIGTFCNDQNACTDGDYCLDGDCLPAREICCADGSDNDLNGFTDCDDAACVWACPVTNLSCRLLDPLTFSGKEGAQFVINVSITAPGVTDFSQGFDTHNQLHVQYAVGPENSEASTFAWPEWFPATPDADAVDATSDFWAGTVTVPDITDLSLIRDYAFRVTGDDGNTWVYCDGDGSENGYATDQAGKITIEPPYQVLMSEYMEGSSNNKALELLNASVFPAYLGDCSISVYANGTTTPTNTFSLPAIDLAPGDVFTICHDSLALGGRVFCDLSNTKLNHNGDDAIELICDGIVQDVFGVIGNDPGTNWGTGDRVTVDRTLRRDCSIAFGTGAAPASFDETQWMGLPKDTWQGFGSRLCTGDCVTNERETCCADGADDDLDGLVDCNDPDCKATPTCFIPVDWCMMDHPEYVRGSVGMEVVGIGFVFVAGKTDATANNDNPVGLVAQYGYGPADTLPDSSWTWDNGAPAATNMSPRPDADTYRYAFIVPNRAEGNYDMAFRFSADGGYSWKYCDLDGSDDGYDPADAGKLEIVSIPNVFISEYVDGTGNDKAIEIFNASGRTLNLNNCAIAYYTDGAVTQSGSFLLEDNLLANNTSWVICKTGSSVDLSSECDEFRSLLTFDGNDSLSLTCEGKMMDSIGRVGQNPGAAGWGTGDVTTTGHTLRRHCDILFGDTDMTDEFDPAVQWWGFPLDTFGGLGNIVCGSPCYEGGKETCCDNVNDDDLDGLADCLDEDCGDAAACQPVFVDYAAVMAPAVVAFEYGSASPVVYGRVFWAGVTSQAGEGAGIIAAAGWGPDGSNPDGHILWTWVDAYYDSDVDGSDDKYMATFSEVPVGTFDYAFKFSADGGENWLYADAEPNGTTDGYSPATTGSMTVNAGTETICDDFIDNDGDIAVDCNDPDCELDVNCIIPTEETDCDDTQDEDQDGLTDCEDPDCDDDVICQEPVDYCQLWAPSPYISQYGTYFQVFGWVAEAGMTDLTEENDDPAGLSGQVGYGPVGTDPDTWTWFDANVGFSNNSPYADADSYYYNLFVPATAGDYDYAFRFSADMGRSWLLCDLDDSANGFDQAGQAGKMTVTDVAPNLIFTEYVEGTANNKAVEIKNLSGRDVMMQNCALELYNNGATAFTFAMALDRNGILADGETWVVCNDLADAALSPLCDSTSSLVSFNGNDALVLRCEESVVDSFGQVGNDPGDAGWGAGEYVTVDKTLRRECNVVAGDTVIDDAFSPSGEWYAYGVDIFLDLGTNICDDPCFNNGGEVSNATCCADTLDNDKDGLADCDDTADCAAVTVCLPPPNLIFSEYGEGTGSNKYVEILNQGTADLNLSQCKVQVFANGSTTGTNITLSNTTLTVGDVWVLCNPSADPALLALCDQTSGSLSHNGDDALVLSCNGTVLDVFGQVGFDPGAEWGTAPGPTTADDNICRSERTPDTVSGDAFVPVNQWHSYGIGYYTGVGVAACP